VTTICVPDSEGARLAQPLPEGVETLVWDGSAAPPEGVERTEFWVPPFGAPYEAMVAAMPHLRVVQARTAGVDMLISVVPDGATLCDGRGVHGVATSEWVLTAILSSLREFPGFVRAQERREWASRMTDELAGKRVLVVGAGDVGEQIARRLRAFDAEPTMVARHAREGVHAIEEVHELLPQSDVVVLVVPMTEETRALADGKFLATMSDGALLVNASRGPVVVTDALLAELESGRLHAALDVTDPEPLPADHPLWSAPNLLLTPHVGGGVYSLPSRSYRLVREQVARYVSSTPLLNVVDGAY
jgi:phosphoglycerate dehydrogenase-like enzyme